MPLTSTKVSFSPQARAAGCGVVAVFVVSALLSFGGCSSEQDDGEQRHRAAQRSAGKGPVSMSVLADRKEARIAETVKLTVDIRAKNGVKVTLPKVDDTLGDFRVISAKDTLDVPEGKQRLWRRTMQLESRKSGKRIIPELVAMFEDRRDPAKPIHGEVKTEPIEVQVVSVLEGKTDPRKFRDIKGAVELRPDVSYTWVYVTSGVAGTFLLAAAGTMLVARYRRNRALTAETWALKQLDKLCKADLIAAGRHQEYYYRLTDIVRAYIERRFSLRTLHETTREFLDDIQTRPVLSEENKVFLRAFLEQADMVKYACYEPGVGESDKALEAARTFVASSALHALDMEKNNKRRRRRNRKEAMAA